MSIISTTIKQVGPNRWINADGLQCTRDGAPLPNEPFVGVIHMGDWHWFQSSGTNDDQADAMALFDQAIDVIIANKTAWNIKFVVTPGDLVDSGTTVVDGGVASNTAWPTLMTRMDRLLDAGIGIQPTLGNHEYAPEFASYITVPWLKRSANFSGETRGGAYPGSNNVFLLDNGPVKLAYVAIDYHGYANSANANWFTTICNKYSDRLIVLSTHVWTDKYGFNMQKFDTANAFQNSGVTLEEARACPNLFMVLSGHFRGIFANSLSFDLQNNGRVVTNSCLNTQQMYSSGKNYFHLHQIYQDRIDIRMYDARLGRFLENGEAAERASTTKNTKLGYWHKFSAPLAAFGKPELPLDAPQFINNLDYPNPAGIAVGPNFPSMNESANQLAVAYIPFVAKRPDGTIGTFSLVTNEVKPRMSVS